MHACERKIMHVFAFKVTCCAAHFSVPFLRLVPYKRISGIELEGGYFLMAPGAAISSTTGVSTTDLTDQTQDLYLMELPAAPER